MIADDPSVVVERRARVTIESDRVHSYETEIPGESLGPFPTVQQCPVEIAAHVAAGGHGLGDGSEMTVQIGDPSDIVGH